MTIRSLSICLLGVASSTFLAAIPLSAMAATGDPARGAQLFGRACGACHSLASGEHRTGPSLAGVVGRKAGTADGFHRYSPPLQSSGVIWDRTTLDPWLADPQAFIPGTRMGFRGLPDAQARADVIAYLAEPGHPELEAPQSGMMGMGGGPPPDLKTLGPEYQVTAIRYCGDTYEVATADGTTEPFWEFNLRFKTDSSARGPSPGRPAIVGTGMMGDRAAVVFASPQEISTFIAAGC